MTREELIASYFEQRDRDKYRAMWQAWSQLARWLETGAVEDGDLVLDRMHDLEDEIINPVTHPIITVELPPLEQETT